MTRIDNHWGADLARRLGVGGTIERLDNREGATLHIRCARGPDGAGHVVDVRIRPNLDPNGTAKHMLNAGWTLGRRKIYCPDCGSRKTPKQKIEAAPLPMIPPEVTPTPSLSGRVIGQQKMMEATRERRSEIVRKGNLTRATRKAGASAPPPSPLPWAQMTPAERMAHARASVSPERLCAKMGWPV